MSIRTMLTFAAVALLGAAAPARAAEPTSISFQDALAAAAAGGFTIPAAWAGVWDYVDTTRACGGGVTDTDAAQDTLCTGDDVTPENEGFPVTLNCTGSVNDTTVDIDCNGVWNFPPDCTATIAVGLDATRTGDTYVATNSLSVVYTGGIGCNAIPDICTVTTTNGTRVGPEPPGCVTPVEVSSWGQVKAYYR